MSDFTYHKNCILYFSFPFWKSFIFNISLPRILCSVRFEFIRSPVCRNETEIMVVRHFAVYLCIKNWFYSCSIFYKRNKKSNQVIRMINTVDIAENS